MTIIRPDPRRWWKRMRERAAYERDCRQHDHRCLECGHRAAPVERQDGYFVECEAHPAALFLCWSRDFQAAAIAATQAVAQCGEPFEQQMAELRQMAADRDPAVKGRRYKALSQVLPLLIAWGGLPGRFEPGHAGEGGLESTASPSPAQRKGGLYR